MIAIVGGGISGLAAAYELTRRGIPFALYEASSRLGGLVRTEHVDGFTIEAGADSLLVEKGAALELCAELGLRERLIAVTPPRTAFVLHHNRLHRLPSPGVFGIPASWNDLAGYSLFSARGRARMAAERLLPPRPREDESVASFFGRRFGREAVTRLAQPLIGGIHAGDIHKLSLAMTAPKLQRAEQTGSVLKWVRQAGRRADAGGGFRSFATGMHELVDAIHARLRADSLRLSEPVMRIARRGDGWSVSSPRGAGHASAVILACPAHAAARLLDDVDRELARECDAIRYVSTVSVALAWPGAMVTHPLRGSGFVVARETNALRITACTWVSSKWVGRAPGGQVLLRAYLGGAHDPEAVVLPDGDILNATVRELSAILGIEGPPALARIYRWPGAGAQHELGHAGRVRWIEARLAGLPGLFMTGSGLRATGVPDCISDGRAIAAKAGMFVDAT